MSIRLALNCTVRWSYVRPTYVGTGVHFSRYTFCSQDYKLSPSREFMLLISVLFFVVVLSFPCILYFQVSLHSIGCPNYILSSQILSFKLLVRYSRSDSQNLVFVLKTVLLAFPSLTSLRCYNLPALWLDKLIRPSFRQPSLNYNAGYFLYVCWYYDFQLAFLTVTTLSDLGSFSGCTSIAP